MTPRQVTLCDMTDVPDTKFEKSKVLKFTVNNVELYVKNKLK